MAWLDNRFCKRIKITITNTGAAQNGCPVGVEIDTAALVTAGLMFDDGREIRITASDEVTLLPFAILSGMNTVATKFGVRVDIPEGESFIYLYFDYVCKTIESVSSGDFWYTSATNENSPSVTARSTDMYVYTNVGGSGGNGEIWGRWSPTFNALNISRFDFDINQAHVPMWHGGGRHWITVTGGDEIFYIVWANWSSDPDVLQDPWDREAEYDASGLTGIHELNFTTKITYTHSGYHAKLTDVISVVLTNHASISIDLLQENCPDPSTPDIYYVKTDGDDGLTGTSLPNAWATLTHAFDTIPGDNANVLRIDEGTHDVWENTGPAQCTNIIGGYHDGVWHDWTPGCGHDRPFVVACGRQFEHAAVTLEGIEFDCESGPISFTCPTHPCVFTNCKYIGMMHTGEARVVFINDLDDVFHVSADGNVTTITLDHYRLVGDDGFDTYDIRNVVIATDDDIDMIIDTWSETGDQNKAWRITADGVRTIEFTLGDMLPDTSYDLVVGGMRELTAVSDASGVVAFPAYNGSFSEKLFETMLGAVPISSELLSPGYFGPPRYWTKAYWIDWFWHNFGMRGFFRGHPSHKAPVKSAVSHKAPVKSDTSNK